MVAADADSYTVTTESKSGTNFSLTRSGGLTGRCEGATACATTADEW